MQVFVLVAGKLLIGFLALIFVINISGIRTVIGKDVEWVKREVAEQGYASIKEVYLGEYRNGSLHCYPERL